MTTPAERYTMADRILAVFEPVSADARVILGEALEIQPVPFLKAVGSALTYSPRLAQMVLARALSSARWDGSDVLVGQLGDSEPWKTIRECLVDALLPSDPTSEDG